MPMLIKAAELARYHRWLTAPWRKPEDLVDLLNRSQPKEQLELHAVGSGTTGLFSRFEKKIPALFMTSSLEHLARSLAQLLTP